MSTIVPINKLKNTSEISKLCHELNEPIFITKNGYGDMVLMSMERYEEIRKIEMILEMKAVKEQADRGEYLSVTDALKELEEKHGI